MKPGTAPGFLCQLISKATVSPRQSYQALPDPNWTVLLKKNTREIKGSKLPPVKRAYLIRVARSSPVVTKTLTPVLKLTISLPLLLSAVLSSVLMSNDASQVNATV